MDESARPGRGAADGAASAWGTASSRHPFVGADTSRRPERGAPRPEGQHSGALPARGAPWLRTARCSDLHPLHLPRSTMRSVDWVCLSLPWASGPLARAPLWVQSLARAAAVAAAAALEAGCPRSCALTRTKKKRSTAVTVVPHGAEGAKDETGHGVQKCMHAGSTSVLQLRSRRTFLR
jgi:hypothetical protein